MKRFSLVLFALLVVLFLGCSGSGGSGDESDVNGDPTDTTASSSVSGLIKDTTGGVLSGITVSIAGGKSTSTGNDGTFSLDADPGTDQIVILTGNGYVTTSKRVDVFTNKSSMLMVTMVPEAPLLTMDASIGAKVIGERNAFLEAPANAFVGKDGNPVTGNVDVFLTPLDPSIPVEAEAYPGNMLGRTTEGEFVFLTTFGVLDVTVRQNGETLQIKDGKAVTIGVPARSQGSTPATTDMWYFDIQTGLWEEIENDGTYDSDTGTYQTQVTHLTPFNSDNPNFPTCITGMVQDAEGNPVIAFIRATPQDEEGEGNITSGFSGLDGSFCIYVQRDSTVLLEVYTAENIGGEIDFDHATKRTIESGGTIPIAVWPMDCSAHCTPIYPPVITIGEPDPGPVVLSEAACVYSETGFLGSEDPFWGTCATGLSDLYKCFSPEGGCTYEMDPFDGMLTGKIFEMIFENGAGMVAEMDYLTGGLETKIYGPDPDNELCGTVVIGEAGVTEFHMDGKVFKIRTTAGGGLEIECDSGLTFTLNAEQMEALVGCSGAMGADDTGVVCEAKSGTYLSTCTYDSDCNEGLSCCGGWGEKKCLIAGMCDLYCTSDADCTGMAGGVCCDAGYLRICTDFNTCQVMQGDEESH